MSNHTINHQTTGQYIESLEARLKDAEFERNSYELQLVAARSVIDELVDKIESIKALCVITP